MKETEIKKKTIVKKTTLVNCPYFKKCGGCRYINKTYTEQLDVKQQNVSKYLKDIAEAQGIKIEKIIHDTYIIDVNKILFFIF